MSFMLFGTSAFIFQQVVTRHNICTALYKGADKSLARPGRKQATATEDFHVHVSYL